MRGGGTKKLCLERLRGRHAGSRHENGQSSLGKDAIVGGGYHDIENGPFPYADGWGWLYRPFERLAPPGQLLRRVVCRYFYPNPVERWRAGLVYKLLGVHLFGQIIPTGGITVRRLTKARMAPYTLGGTSRSAARAFYYRACVFEALHLPFLLTLLVLAVDRTMSGRPDLAIENTVVNLLANVYPVMHHRRTRMRIVQLLRRSASPDGASTRSASDRR